MFQSLHLENFKSWRDTGELDLKPITVFFGSNSSGKTSLMESLVLLKQTIESSDRRRALDLGGKHSPIELGTFFDIVYRHEEDRTVRFDFSWDLPERLEVEDSKNSQSYSGDALSFATEIRQRDENGSQLSVGEMSYQLLQDDSVQLAAGMRRQPDENGKRRYDLTTENFEVKWQKGRRWLLPSPARFYGFPNEAVAHAQNTEFLTDLTLQLENKFERTYYLGPLRENPERVYTWTGGEPEHVGWRGERAIEAILAARNRRFNRGPYTTYKYFEEVIARWLNNMGLIAEFQTKRMGDRGKSYRIRVRTPGSQDFVNLPDVGFGVSQVLPVIVSCFYTPPNSTLLLEQPEIHLHPRVQASLADLFIEATQSKEKIDGDGVERNVQLLIESHSEHFLRRLQRRVAEQEIDESDVAIYFSKGPRPSSTIERLEVDEYGNISNWPKGFFGDEIDDLTARMEAEMKRQTGGSADE